MPSISFSEQVILPLSENLQLYTEKPAFCIGGRFYTYDHLAQRVNTIRTQVRQLQPKGQVVALLVGDHIDTYASIIALWWEGLAYVPLHPLQPDERNLNIIAQTGTTLLLHATEGSTLTAAAASHGVQAHCTAQWESTAPTASVPPCEVEDSRLAYILFTSGSTGTPKGVSISRLNLAAFIDSFWQTGFALGPDDRCLQAFDLTFDVSIQAFLTALLRGACVYTIPYGQVKYIHAASLLMEQGITSAAMAPSMLTYLRPYFDQLGTKSLRTTILTAEACPVDLIEDWFACAPNAEVYDFYGPTEGTIYCTCYHLSRQRVNLSANGVAAIGKPLANVHAVIVDEEGHQLPAGQKGELYIAGHQVTQGYWNNPERNSTAFTTLTCQGTSMRFYRTGDLCAQLEDGNILYYGRIDLQAKIQGYRVELGEIEYHARNYYSGQYRTVAIAFTNNAGLTEIALFVETETTDPAPLKQYLQAKLPHYMLPSKIIFLKNFPTNKSEKIDRTALKETVTA